MASYYAMFLPAEEGGYCIFFPDFPVIATQGNDIDDCLLMGEDALKVVIEDMVFCREKLPEPSDYDTAYKAMMKEWEEGEFFDKSRKPMLQLFKAPCTDEKPVKVTISLPRSVLVSIDQAAKNLGLTRSGYIAKATADYSDR